MLCSSCWKQNPDTAPACGSCGATLTLSQKPASPAGARPSAPSPPRPPGSQPSRTSRPSDSQPLQPSSRASRSGKGATDVDRTGAVIADRFELLELLGRGGMGAVYRARDAELGEEVALKLLQASLTEDARERDRLKREIITARRISHPNVIRIFEFGVSAEGEGFVAMEVLPGGSLVEMIRGGTLSLEQAANIGAGIADGLAAAHEQGIIHRDVKPHNVLFDAKGRPKLLDFGLARLSAAATTVGGFSGTPHYMSPEQADGRELDARSDVYSLGVLLFELFTGELPFAADSLVRLIMMHTNEAPPIPTEVRPEIPLSLNQLVLKCLAKDPDDRYANAAEVATTLRLVIQQGLPTTPMGPPTGASPRATQLSASRSQPRAATGLSPAKSVAGASRNSVAAAAPSAAPARSKAPLIVAAIAVPVLGGGIFLAMNGLGLGTRAPVSTPTPVVAASPTPAAVAVVTTQAPETPAPTPEATPEETPTPAAAAGAATPKGKATPKPTRTTIAKATPVPAVVDDGPLADPEAAARNEGFLKISVTGGWAQVFIDGKLIDTTPIALPIAVKAGSHELKLVNPALKEHTETIRITPGGTLEKRVSLQPK